MHVFQWLINKKIAWSKVGLQKNYINGIPSEKIRIKEFRIW